MSAYPPLILASASAVRQQMLRERAVLFEVVRSPFDEERAKPVICHLPAQQQAAFLASGKAEAVSQQHKGALVIGADQICAAGEQILDKPGTVARAKAHLQRLRGRAHDQHSAVCLYYAGQCLFAYQEQVRLEMRELSDAEIDAYINRDQPLSACGAYCYERSGHELFTHVEGSADAIKGLPLEALLDYVARLIPDAALYHEGGL